MDSILDLLGAGASVASGGIFGLLGAGMSAWFKTKQQAADRLWQKEKWTYESDMMDKQILLGNAEAENEIKISNAEGSWAGLSASISADAAGSKGASQWATNVKTLFRPFLTTLLWALAAWVFAEILAAMVDENHPMAKIFSVEEIKDIIRYMVYTVFFCASTATTWWFGDRALAPPGTKHS